MLIKRKPIDFLNDPPWKILVSVVWPLLLVNTVQLFTSLLTSRIASVYVGQTYFSVSGYLSTVFTFVSTFISGITSAAWIVSSRNFIRQDKEVMQHYLSNAAFSIILILLPSTILLILFSGPILSLMGIPAEFLSVAKEYFQIYCLSFLPSALSSFLVSFLNGTGSARRILAINLFSVCNGTLVNVLMLAVFKTGIMGAASLPLINALIQLCLNLTLLRRESLFSFSAVCRKIRNPDWKVAGQIIRYGGMISLQSILCSIGYLTVSFQANRHLSSEYISILSVSLPLASFMSVLSTAVSAFCPRCYASGNSQRLKRFFHLVTICGLIYGLVCFGVYAALGRWYYGLLFTDPIIISLGAEYWFWQGLSYPFLSLMFTVRYFLDAVGQSKFSLLSGLGELTGNLLCAFWLIPAFGNIGRSLSYPLGWFLGAFMLTVSYFIVRKQIYRYE